jgi:SAM-dependent methyltransferase
MDPRSQTASLRAAWDENADAWVQWARNPEVDHAFWNLNLPALLALLPSPGDLTLDVGCGEGRLARRLTQLGHHVVGIEGSPQLAQAAREADPALEVHVADAADMPLDQDTADLAVMSLALMNMDDVSGVVREVARVLRPGSRFCLSILHPINSWGDAGDVGYFGTVQYVEQLERDGHRMTFHDTHRPLSEYFRALEEAGFLIERLREPVPSDAYAAERPEVSRWRTRPSFLHVRALLR